jgi:hypothetical protein
MAEITLIPRKDPTFLNLDLTKPIPWATMQMPVIEDDCFGIEWEATHKVCNKCADFDICMITFHKRQNKRVKKVEKEAGGFMSSTNFDLVNKAAILAWIDQTSPTVEELLAEVNKTAKCPDPGTLRYWVQNWKMEEPLLSIKKGICKLRK